MGGSPPVRTGCPRPGDLARAQEMFLVHELIVCMARVPWVYGRHDHHRAHVPGSTGVRDHPRAATMGSAADSHGHERRGVRVGEVLRTSSTPTPLVTGRRFSSHRGGVVWGLPTGGTRYAAASHIALCIPLHTHVHDHHVCAGAGAHPPRAYGPPMCDAITHHIFITLVVDT